MKPQIVATNLRKVYRVPEREAGLRAAFGSLVHRRFKDVLAADDVSFAVEPGEVVGFIGPNGAGKTTTLKMLTGILYPTAGEAQVEGFTPWERKPEFLRRISMVMGNKNQLLWDTTVMDAFLVLGEIYRVPRQEFQRTLDGLVSLLELKDLLRKLPRNLSLGERMKCELAAALLHRPRVLFLDEPTLGLDVTMQFRLRRFIAEYNRETGATVMLTSHYMADVVSLCPRVLLIHEGRLLYDGELAQLAARLAPFRLIRLAVGNGNGQAMAGVLAELGELATVIEQNEQRYTLRVRRGDAAQATARLLQGVPLADLTIEDPPIEAVIDQVYREGVSL